jgi:DNA replication licensing factor MCM2
MHSYDAGLNVKNGFPVFSTCLEANYIQKREDVYSLYSLTDEDKGAILDLGKDPRIGEFSRQPDYQLYPWLQWRQLLHVI